MMGKQFSGSTGEAWFRANGTWRQRTDGSWHGHIEMTTGPVDERLLKNLAPKFLAQLIEEWNGAAGTGKAGLLKVGNDAGDHVDGFLSEDSPLRDESAEQ